MSPKIVGSSSDKLYYYLDVPHTIQIRVQVDWDNDCIGKSLFFTYKTKNNYQPKNYLHKDNSKGPSFLDLEIQSANLYKSINVTRKPYPYNRIFKQRQN